MVDGVENILQYLQRSWSELLFWAVRASTIDVTVEQQKHTSTSMRKPWHGELPPINEYRDYATYFA